MAAFTTPVTNEPVAYPTPPHSRSLPHRSRSPSTERGPSPSSVTRNIAPAIHAPKFPWATFVPTIAVTIHQCGAKKSSEQRTAELSRVVLIATRRRCPVRSEIAPKIGFPIVEATSAIAVVPPIAASSSP